MQLKMGIWGVLDSAESHGHPSDRSRNWEALDRLSQVHLPVIASCQDSHHDLHARNSWL